MRARFFIFTGWLGTSIQACAASWGQTSAPTNNWTCIACSADGSKLIAGSEGAIYLSTNWGLTWASTAVPLTNWISVASSADGTKLFAAVNGGDIYASSDSGGTWMQMSAPVTNWTSVACSADGMKALAVAANSLHPYSAQEGAIYLSSDSGTNWAVSSAPLGRWISVASSAEGNKLVAAQPFGICTSIDSGATWSTTSAPGYTASVACSAAGSLLFLGGADPFHFPYGSCLTVSTNCGKEWNSCNASTVARGSVACSADGRTLIGAGGPPTSPIGLMIDVIQTSSDSGATWTVADAPAQSWTGVASSADGGMQVAVACGGGIWMFQSATHPWTPTIAPSNYWLAVACSADGTKLIAAGLKFELSPIHISTNSGASWLAASGIMFGSNWSVACSADGIKMVAATGGAIYTSADSGASWTNTSAPTSSWTAVASSADGHKLVALGADSYPCHCRGIYTSTNGGVTWLSNAAPFSVPSYTLSSPITLSTDGARLAVMAYGASGGNHIYTSTNTGADWLESSAPGASWRSIAGSADGSKLVAAGYFGFPCYCGVVYTSTNLGATWTSNSLPTQSYDIVVASSSDGRHLVAATSFPGSIYISSDSGATWVSNNSPTENWRAIAASADGAKLVAATFDGGIWTLQSTPAPHLAIQRSAGDVRISWTVPSLKFSLQQSSDPVADWTEVTNTSALNLTNVALEVSLPAGERRGFYRLKR